MKRILSLLMTFCFILSFNVISFAETKVVYTPTYLENNMLSFENPILNIDGTTYYPMRQLLNELGVSDDNILWDADTKTVTMYSNNTITLFEIGSSIAIENGTSVDIKTPPIIYNNSTYLPIRPVAEACGLSVLYDQATKTIKLTK